MDPDDPDSPPPTMDARAKIVEASVLVVCDILLVMVFLLGTASNSIVLLVFYRRPGLRTLSNRFVINLLATNLLACCILLPLVFADNLRGHGDGSPALCAISEGVAAAICAASVLAVLLVAVDQFLAVVDPLHYHMRINAPRSAAMIATAWISAGFLGLLGSGAPMLFPGADPGSSLWHACGAGVHPNDTPGELVAAHPKPSESPSAAVSAYRAAFAGAYAILVFAIPVIALCCIYLRIYAAAHRNSQRTRRTGSGPLCPIPQSNFDVESSAPSAPATAAAQPLLPPLPTTTISITPPTPTGAAVTPPTLSPSPSSCSPPSSIPSTFPSPQSEAVKVIPPTPPPTNSSRAPSRAASVRSTSSQLVNSLKYRISNASLFRYREGARAARVSALVVVMALVCWFPYTAALVLHSGIFPIAKPSDDPEIAASSPHYMDAVSLALLSAGSLVSPCLFAYRNRRLQREVRRLLGCRRGAKQRRSTLHRSNTTHHNGTFLNGGGSMHDPNRLATSYGNTTLELFSGLTEGKVVSTAAAESHIGVDPSEPKKRKDGCLPLPTVPPHSGGGHGTGKKFLVTVYGKSRWSRSSSEKATCEFVPESALNVDTCRSSFSSGTTQGTSSTDNVEE